jgi:hypothetical protein
LIEVLLLHRHLAHADVLAGVTGALTIGSVNADVVAVEARKAAAVRGSVKPDDVIAPSKRERIASLTERRLTELPPDERPLPSVAPYDALLGKASS